MPGTFDTVATSSQHTVDRFGALVACVLRRLALHKKSLGPGHRGKPVRKRMHRLGSTILKDPRKVFLTLARTVSNSRLVGGSPHRDPAGCGL